MQKNGYMRKKRSIRNYQTVNHNSTIKKKLKLVHKRHCSQGDI